MLACSTMVENNITNILKEGGCKIIKQKYESCFYYHPVI